MLIAIFSLDTVRPFALLLSALGLIVLGTILYVFIDYQNHKSPLKQADPRIRYGLMHHVKVVTIPLLKYRLSLQIYPADRERKQIRKY